MHSTARALLVVALVLSPGATAWGAPRNARTEEPRDARARARVLANEGYALFQAKRYRDALARFRQADETFHAPTLSLMIARSQERLGELASAASTYRRMLDEPLDLAAPKEFRDAKTDARDELDGLTRRAPKLLLVGPQAAAVTILVDGVVMPTPAIGAPLVLDPGLRTIEVRAEGKAAIVRSIAFELGKTHTVDLTDEKPRDTPLGTRKDETDEPARFFVPAIVSFSVGLAGLGLGSATGVLALEAFGELERRCPTKRCAASDAAFAEDADRFATLSTVGFVVAGVGGALGTTLVLLEPTEGDGVVTDARIELVPSGLRLRGRF